MNDEKEICCKNCIEKELGFEKELERLINKYSMENGSDTPDFILAAYLKRCIENFNITVNRREKWYGRDLEPVDITGFKIFDCEEEARKSLMAKDLKGD